MNKSLPQSVRAVLWSYDTNTLDTMRDKDRIILQTLNHGSEDAIVWLKTTYSKEELSNVLEKSSVGEWSKKSLNFWSLMLHTKPKRIGRFV
jgi:hypothetical protein